PGAGRAAGRARGLARRQRHADGHCGPRRPLRAGALDLAGSKRRARRRARLDSRVHAPPCAVFRDRAAARRLRRREDRVADREDGDRKCPDEHAGFGARRRCEVRREDRKSTRLNSSHRTISYAVFCLKKKKNKNIRKEDATIKRVKKLKRKEKQKRNNEIHTI